MIDQQKYSYYMKRGQAIAIGIGIGIIVFATIKGYGHLELHMDRPAEEYQREFRHEEIERTKEVERYLNPDRTSSEQREMDKLIEEGWRTYG